MVALVLEATSKTRFMFETPWLEIPIINLTVMCGKLNTPKELMYVLVNLSEKSVPACFLFTSFINFQVMHLKSSNSNTHTYRRV